MELALELSTKGFELPFERIWISRVRRRRGARPRAGRGGDRVLAGGGRAGRADRAPRPRGQLLAVGPDRAVRALLGAVPGPRAGVRLRRRPAGRRHRALPRVLEPGVHAVRPGRRRLAHPAAEQEHRHRHGARPHGGGPPGRGVGVRDRPAAAAGGAGRGAVGSLVRAGRADHPRAADPRGPRARGDLPARPTAWCPRTRTAGTSCAGSCAGRCTRGACSGSSAGLLVRAGRAHRRGDGRRLSRAPSRVADHRALGAGRGAGLRAHARAGRAAAGRARGRRPRGGHVLGVRGGRVQAPRHLRLSVRDDEGAAGRAGALGGRPGLRGADGPRPRGLPPARARRLGSRCTRITTRCSASRAGRASPPASWATRPPRRRRWCAPSSKRTAACSRSSRRARSTRRAAARCPTPGSWRRRRDARGWWTSTAWATTRRSRSSRSRARSRPATPCGPPWSATRASRRCATTRPRTCSTPRCASGSARTCARRAPTWARTSCASTSPTASA